MVNPGVGGAFGGGAGRGYGGFAGYGMGAGIQPTGKKGDKSSGAEEFYIDTNFSADDDNRVPILDRYI